MPRAVIPAAVMTPDGQYGEGWKVWCQRHGVSLLAFVQEGLRRRRLHGIDREAHTR